jgi:hypothetical protein
MEKIEEWDENVNIDWWKESRIKLNKVIRKYNKWVDRHSEDKIKTDKLLVKIDKHLEKHYCNQDGGSGYKEALNEMKEIVETKRLKL